MDEPLHPYESPLAVPEIEDSLGEIAEAEGVEPSVWGFWATMGWTLLCGFVALAVQMAAAVPFMLNEETLSNPNNINVAAESLVQNGLYLALATLISMPVAVGFFAVPVYLKRWTMREYLALRWVPARQALASAGALLLFLLAIELVSLGVDQESVSGFMVQIYETSGSPVLLGLALVVGAPVMEEIVFRGFMFRGLAVSIGAFATIVLTSAMWTALHIQYGQFELAYIFVLGLVLGAVRQHTKSTSLPIALHAMVNLIATLQTAYYVHSSGA